jgi:predicted ATP-binding protein involved in virulence
LNVIRKAIEIFCSKISNMYISNLRTKDIKENTNIVMDWDGLELSLSQLSEGQRNLLLLVSDIAFSLLHHVGSGIGLTDRGESEDILNRNGIVLIDEIELHLHPQWQREVIPALQKTFPNIQFIVTTHSPQVLSRVHRDDIFILKDNEIYQPSINPIGRDSNDILDEIMGVTKRPEDIQKLSDNYFLLINKNLFEEAQEVRKQLLSELDKKDPIFIRADAIIARKNLLRK